MKNAYHKELDAHKSQVEAFKKTKEGQKVMQELDEKRIEKSLKKKQASIKEMKDKLGKPKRPMGAFFLFSKEKVATVQASSQTEKIKEIAKMWNNLSDAEKEPYVAKSKAEMAAYEKELAKWEKKMANSGEGMALLKMKDSLKATKSRAMK